MSGSEHGLTALSVPCRIGSAIVNRLAPNSLRANLLARYRPFILIGAAILGAWVVAAFVLAVITG